MNAHALALEIEWILRKVFNFDSRGEFAGLIDADTIERNWYVPIAAGLGYLYAKADEAKKVEIETFINNYGFYLEFKIYKLLEFQNAGQEIDGYSIEFDNGELAVEKIIESLKKVCNY